MTEKLPFDEALNILADLIARRYIQEGKHAVVSLPETKPRPDIKANEDNQNNKV